MGVLLLEGYVCLFVGELVVFYLSEKDFVDYSFGYFVVVYKMFEGCFVVVNWGIISGDMVIKDWMINFK